MEYDIVTERRLAASDILLNYEVNNLKLLKMHKSDAKTRLILGGKRSGKTTWGCVECCWAALGTHPYLDYPKPPLKIRVCGVSNEGVRAILIPMFQEWLPPQAVKSWPTRDNVIIHLANGSFVEFKCFRGDQLVLLADGTYRRIDQILPGDRIFCQGTKDKVISVHTKQIDTFLKICSSGNEIVCSPEHRIMTPFGWKEAKDLQIGDQFIITHHEDSGIEIEDWKVAWLGALLGDGCFREPKGEILFSCNRSDLLIELSKMLPEELHVRQRGKTRIGDYVISRKGYGGPHVKNSLKDFIRGLGLLGCGSYEKFVPDLIFKLSNRQIALFLRFLFSTDGGTSGRQINYVTVSPKLAYGVKLLLNKLGINCSKNSYKYGEQKFYKILFGGNDNLNQYYNRIGFSGEGRIKQISCKREHNYYRINRIEEVHGGLGYDLEVEGNHIYTIDNVVVHNSYEQTVEKYEGTERHLVWMDEEPPKDLYESNFMRTISKGIDGKLIITCTPLHGMNWIYDELYDNAMAIPPAVDHVHVSIFDNPHLGTDALEKIKKDPAMQDSLDAVLYGNFVPKSGLVYKEFGDKHIITHPINKPDKDWVIVLGMDLHNRNPHGVVFMGLNKDNAWTVYDEIYEHCTIADLASKIKAKMGDTWPPAMSICDTSSNEVQSISGLTEAQVLQMKYGFYIVPAHKDVDAGIAKVISLLKGDKPALKISEHCRNTVREFHHYVWEDWARSKDKYDLKEVPRKKDDHLMDAIRYVSMAQIVYRPPGFKYEPKKPQKISHVTGYY